MAITAEELMDNAPGLLAYARSLTHNEDDAQDLLQDVMLRAIERGGTFRGESSLTTWLHRIMHHRHVDLVRHRDPVLVEPERLAALVERSWRDDTFTVDAGDVVARAEVRDDLLDALSRLPVILRSAVVLHDVAGMTTAEIAAVQHVGLPAAKQRLRRGRAALMHALASDAERRIEPPAVPLRCWKARVRIDDYLDDALTTKERRQLEVHLEGCPTCPGLYAAIVGVTDAVGRLRDPDSTVEPTLADRIQRMLDEAEHPG
ncbi:MAG: sigma-70 family RNA polymerase sigma factor [Actinobacteria bacterium]|nr:sigma-70 family RNA polymerase sigma factor [Thermoleophilia bacterium]MCB9011142.1 sigma-70 family RNA polymerase sigma factor [Actinomycetota bacterium]